MKIAQHSVPTPSVPLRPEKQQLYQQGIQLVTEAQKLEKKGTREGYQQAIAIPLAIFSMSRQTAIAQLPQV